jgi:hypothetical protein
VLAMTQSQRRAPNARTRVGRRDWRDPSGLATAPSRGRESRSPNRSVPAIARCVRRSVWNAAVSNSRPLSPDGGERTPSPPSRRAGSSRPGGRGTTARARGGTERPARDDTWVLRRVVRSTGRGGARRGAAGVTRFGAQESRGRRESVRMTSMPSGINAIDRSSRPRGSSGTVNTVMRQPHARRYFTSPTKRYTPAD